MYIVMALIVAGLILLPLSPKKAKAYKDFLLDNALWTSVIALILGVGIDMAGFPDSFLYDQMLEVVAVLVLASPYLIIRKALKKKKAKEAPARTVEVSSTPVEKIDIPDTAAGRTKIIKKFNTKYNLTLTDLEIEKIVNGSFQNKQWAKEIEAMNRNYTSASEWYAAETGWLRAYLKAFNVQNISSDFAYQKQVCINNFEQVFSSMDMAVYTTNDECVKAINNRFMTNFDEMSFMIAYRFLEANGKHHNLPNMGVVSVDQELAKLERKYQTTNMQ